MPLIRRRRVPFALEHMAQVAAAVAADDLSARHAEGAVRVPDDGAGDAVEVGGPAAAGFELVGGAVERGGAGGAGVGAGGGGVLVVGAGEGGFGAFFAEDPELFCPGMCGLVYGGDIEGEGRGYIYTFIQDGSPFIIALLDRVFGHVFCA